MKKIVIVLIFILAFVVVSVVAVLAYHGFFEDLKVVEKEMGPYTVATKRFVGSYYKVGPVMTEVDASLRNMGVNSTKGIGLYYDDPSQQKQDKLRSDVGNVLEGVNEDTIATIRDRFEVKEIKRQKAVVVAYPIKSPLSYMLAPMKAYPAISQYWKEKGYPETGEGYGIELYDIPAKTTYYIMNVPVASSQTNQATDEEIIEGISKTFALRSNKPLSSLDLAVTYKDENFAKGSIRFKDEMGGALWFAAKTTQGWELAHDGQGPMSCESAQKYEFPKELVPACIDTANGNSLKTR